MPLNFFLNNFIDLLQVPLVGRRPRGGPPGEDPQVQHRQVLAPLLADAVQVPLLHEDLKRAAEPDDRRTKVPS